MVSMTPLSWETTKVLEAAKVFTGDIFEIGFHVGKDKKAIKYLAEYIDCILGEYNYYTAINKCYVTLKTAIANKYMYIRNGRPRIMEAEAVLEWVFYHHPELEHSINVEELEKVRDEYLNSPNLYYFHKIDTVDVNVFRRMTRGNNTPDAFIRRNLKGLHKENNKHLVGEEQVTRRHLYNTYLALLRLWQDGIVPVVHVADGKNLKEESTEVSQEDAQ